MKPSKTWGEVFTRKYKECPFPCTSVSEMTKSQKKLLASFSKPMKKKTIKAYLVWIKDKNDISGCIPAFFDEKLQTDMVRSNSALFSTFEKKKWAVEYGKKMHKKGSYKVVPCQISYEVK